MVCIAAFCAVLSGTAHAEGEHMHDGFFLRLAPGIGVMSTSEKYGANKYEYSGASGHFNFAIGGAVVENFIVHLDLSGVSMSEPKFKVNGQSTSGATGDHNTSIAGLGLTYYLPSNFYLTGAVGTAKTSMKVNGNTYETDKGIGFNVMVGKEWWVSDNWGLGVAGQWLYAKCPDKPVAGTTPDVITSAFGVLFSATYN
jgi:hypothetical protein